ncbi:unnamed protein product, partial [Discosporangium mesarthrocarpum]
PFHVGQNPTSFGHQFRTCPLTLQMEGVQGRNPVQMTGRKGRADSDQILFFLLRENGCPIPPGLGSVSQMTSDAVIGAVGSLLCWATGGLVNFPTRETLRMHTSDRLRLCADMAKKAKELGYSDSLQAYDLLYPSETNTRRLLVTLLSIQPSSPPPLLDVESGSSPPLSPPHTTATHDAEGQQSEVQNGEVNKKEEDLSGEGVISTATQGETVAVTTEEEAGEEDEKTEAETDETVIEDETVGKGGETSSMASELGVEGGE